MKISLFFNKQNIVRESESDAVCILRLLMWHNKTLLQRVWPAVSMILASFIWGGSYALIKVALQEVGPTTFIFLRFSLASLVMLPGLTFYQFRLDRKDVSKGLVLGLLLVGVHFFQTIGMRTISASLSAFLTGLAVVFVLCIRLMVQRKTLHWLDGVMGVVCVLGLALVTGSSGIPWDRGVSYTLISAFFVALHTYGLSHCTADGEVYILTLLQMVVLTFVAALWMIVTGGFQWPVLLKTWCAILLCAVFCSAVAFGLQAHAQRCLDAVQAAVMLTLEPVFSLLFAHVILGEVFCSSFYGGVCCLLGAVMLASLRLGRST